jgi:hypothetical protein
MMQVLKRKFNKGYMQSVGYFNIFRQEERRHPSPLPRSLGRPEDLEGMEKHSYAIVQQAEPRSYPIKYDVDPTDPVNWGL